ncbi:serine hydrolase [Lentilactobacillus raoultii]|uniref:Serine hydrolase n=1 Tax=Lentilactobacillus raoultii TaxID=1987503 RepID=A0ABW3PPF6_9LACO|nr:serine hydrolase [Lentilactobacillus raoultii]
MTTDIFQKINRLLATSSQRVGLVINVDHEQKLAVNANQAFRSASLIKLGILNDVLAHAPSLTQLIKVKPDLLVGGAGVLQLLSVKVLPLRDLLSLMISVSDNSATNLVIDQFGLAKINQFLKVSGFSQTRLNRYLMDTTALNRGIDNYTSPAESLALLETILEKYPIARQWFLNQQFRYKLPGAFDESGNGIQVFNKTGEGYQIDHDVAKFVYRNHSIAIALLTFGSKNRANTIHLFNQVGQLCATYLMQLAK